MKNNYKNGVFRSLADFAGNKGAIIARILQGLEALHPYADLTG